MLLVMMDKESREMKILIFMETKNKLRDDLKTYGILIDVWDPVSLDTELCISIKKRFVDVQVKIMQNNECKTKSRVYSAIGSTLSRMT